MLYGKQRGQMLWEGARVLDEDSEGMDNVRMTNCFTQCSQCRNPDQLRGFVCSCETCDWAARRMNELAQRLTDDRKRMMGKFLGAVGAGVTDLTSMVGLAPARHRRKAGRFKSFDDIEWEPFLGGSTGYLQRDSPYFICWECAVPHLYADRELYGLRIVAHL